MVQIRLTVIEENPEKLCMLDVDGEFDSSLLIRSQELESICLVCFENDDFQEFFDVLMEFKYVDGKSHEENLESGWEFESFSDLSIRVAEVNRDHKSKYLKEKP